MHVLIWINGAFGSGKTTLVGELRLLVPDALVFDPETVGYLLREVVDVPTADFQDLRLWRRQVAEVAIGLVEEYGRPLLVPMTLVNRGYLDEIFGALDEAGVSLRHFFLNVPKEVLVQRIEGRTVFPGEPKREKQVQQWCKDRIDQSAQADLPTDTVFLDGELSPRELAEAVVKEAMLKETEAKKKEAPNLPS